jgi:hypothetical protein
MSQNAQQEGKTRPVSRPQMLPSDPIGCYLPLLLIMFVLSFGAYVYIVTYLPIYHALSGSGGASAADKVLIGLHIPLGALFSWMLSGIIICLLLLLWFRLLTWFKLRHARAVFAVVLGAVVIWWIAGLAGHLEGAEPDSLFQFMVGVLLRLFLAIVGVSIDQVMPLIPPVSVVILAIGVLALPALWCRRSMIGPMFLPFWLMVGLWLLWCLALIWGMGEWRVGVELLISMAAGLLFFMVGLRPASGSLLPLPGRDHWGKALGFLQDWAAGYNFPGCVVVDELYEEDRVEERVPGHRFRQLGDAPGFIIDNECHYAVAVSSNTKFKGVKGPGVIFTGYADQVIQTVDLRPQLRTFPVEAVTKDGIRIKTGIFAPCKVDSRGKPPKLGEHLPYSPAAGFKAIRSQEMRHEGQGQTRDRMKGYKWEELPRLIATRILQDIVSRYEFDDLYGPYQPGGDPPRKVIAQELLGRLRDELKEIGIELVGGGISELQSVEEVYVKRAQNWKEEWEHRIALQKAEGQAEWLQMLERARAEAQADLILNLGRRLEELSVTRAERRPQAALSLFVQLLDELMKQQPTLGKVVPEETLQALLTIRQAVE